MVKSSAIENIFKSWGPFMIYQLINLDNPAQFYTKRTKLAVLISMALLFTITFMSKPLAIEPPIFHA